MKIFVSVLLALVLLFSANGAIIAADANSADESDNMSLAVDGGTETVKRTHYVPFTSLGLNGFTVAGTIEFSYKYEIVDGQKRIVEVDEDNITSYFSGIVGTLKLHQDGVVCNILSTNSENDTIEITVKGTYTLLPMFGLLSSRGGYVTLPYSWSCTYTLPTD